MALSLHTLASVLTTALPQGTQNSYRIESSQPLILPSLRTPWPTFLLVPFLAMLELAVSVAVPHRLASRESQQLVGLVATGIARFLVAKLSLESTGVDILQACTQENGKVAFDHVDGLLGSLWLGKQH